MTDNDLFNALVRCTGIHTSTTCLDCPYSARQGATVHYGDVYCKDALLQGTLSLISRQKAEIERLSKCVKTEDEVREIMRSQMTPMVKEITAEQIDRAHWLGKIEGITDFVARLKEKASSIVASHNGVEIPETRTYQISASTIGELLKEFVEEKK